MLSISLIFAFRDPALICLLVDIWPVSYSSRIPLHVAEHPVFNAGYRRLLRFSQDTRCAHGLGPARNDLNWRLRAHCGQ